MQRKETAARAVGSIILSQLTMTIMVATVMVTVAETVIVVTMTIWVMS